MVEKDECHDGLLVYYSVLVDKIGYFGDNIIKLEVRGDLWLM